MSVVVPGSAQFVVGNRTVGRWAMRIWAGVLAVLLLVVLGLWLLQGPTVAFLLHPVVAPVLRVVVWVLLAGWALLLLDAWRLARPLGLARNTRLALTISCLSLIVVAGFGTSVASGALRAVQNMSEVFAGGGDVEQKAGRYNILLLGADAGAGRDGLRPDSINVASIDAATGRTVIFGLPRNLQKAPFPADSPLAKLYPEGYVCADGECMLNGIYTLGMDHKDLFPGQDAGLVAMRQVVQEILGLDINYYAMVDMAGFSSLIDAMGGIRLDISKAIPIGGVSTKISGYIGPGTNVQLDGYNALWFARSRSESNDYERMVRQKCVMNAMAKQLDPAIVAARFVDMSEAGKDILRTDVGPAELPKLAELALAGRSLDVTSVNFTPPLITSSNPDFALIRKTVTDSIAASQALDAPQPETSPSVTPETQETQSPSGAPSSEPSSTPTESGAPEPDWICRVSQ